VSIAGWIDRGRKRLAVLTQRNPLHAAAVAVLVIGVALVLAILYGDLPEFVRFGGREMRQLFNQYSFLPGYVLLYVEESGVPLPAPGDVFVMFIGVHIPHTIWAWLVAWFGLVLVVTLGATNLYLISRRFGRRLVHGRFAEYVHLTPERLTKAEHWFQKYGVLAIIFGRHIPGFRVPITVMAGTLGVPYRVFAPSVAVSTAIWAGVMLTLGVTIGPRVALLLHAHGWIYFIWGVIVAGLVVGMYLNSRRRAAERGARPESKRPVESPSS
jgi:membrane protein DedA with SNARE-associated domain